MQTVTHDSCFAFIALEAIQTPESPQRLIPMRRAATHATQNSRPEGAGSELGRRDAPQRLAQQVVHPRDLGLIPGAVGRIDATPLPHVGWNSVDRTDDPVFAGLAAEPLFYFVHTFAARPRDERSILGWTTYGKDAFASAVRAGSVTGFQFHPERSGPAGLQVLANFVMGSTEVHRVA